MDRVAAPHSHDNNKRTEPAGNKLSEGDNWDVIIESFYGVMNLPPSD